MGVAERYKKNQTSNAEQTLYNGVENRYSINSGIVKDIENSVNTWLQNNNNFISNAQYRAQNKGGYVADSGEWLSTITTQKNNFDREAERIKSLVAQHKDVLDPQWVHSINSLFDENGKTQADIVAGFTEENSYWNQWENEDMYNEWVAWEQKQKFLLHLDADAAKKQADTLESALKQGEDLQYKRAELVTLKNRVESDMQYKANAGWDVSNDKELIAEYEAKIAELDRQMNEFGATYGASGKFDLGSLKEQAAKLREDATYATYKQTGERLKKEALSAPDFETNTKYGTEAGGWVIGDKDYILNWLSQSKYDKEFYDNMNEEEKKILGYYLAHPEEDGLNSYAKATDYLYSIEETVNGRIKYGIVEDKDTAFEKLLFSVSAGLDQFGSGLGGAINAIVGNDKYIPATATQMASGEIRQGIEESEGFWNGVLGVAYDFGTTTANMMPSILVGMVNPVVGTTLMGVNAGGNAYNEMINLGYDKNQARAYGVMVGASEALLEKALGGMSAFGGGGAKLTTKMLSKVDNALARWAIKTGGSMLSEFTEESLQTILEPWFESIVTGADYEAPGMDEVLYSGLLGALSAGVLEGGGNAINAGVTTYRGSKVKKADGAVEKLKKLGTSFSADSVASQLAGRVTNESGAYTIGRLFQEVGATLSAQNKSDIIIGLTKRGVDESSAKKIANTYEAFLNGEMSLTDEQVRTLEGLDPLNDVLKKNIIGVNTDVYQRTREYSDILDLISNKETKTETPSAPEAETAKAPQTFAPYSKEYIETMAKEFEAMGMPAEHARLMAQSNLSAPTQDNVSPTKENAVQSKYEVSAEGKTINTKSGEIANIKNIESISKGGEANLTLDDGMVVKASDLSFGTDAEAIFVENIGAIKIGKNPISTTSANALYMTAMSALESNPNMTADEAMSLIKGLEESYVYGTYNLGRSKLTARNEDGSARLYAGELSQAHRKYAYELGTKDAVSKTEADQKVIDDLKAKAEGKTAKKSLGKIIFEKGAEVADESALTDTQRANLNGIKLLAEISSVEFHVFRSDKNNKFKYTMPDGTVTTANGWFVAGTNQIWIDLNAGNSGEGTMVRTAAHEISHYIKEWSPQKWRAMADMLMETFAKNGVDTESMLNKQIAKIKRRYNKNNMPSQPKLLDMAYEELVCDALSDMLTDGSIVNFIAEVKAKDASLGKKIINAIKNLLKKWGLIIDSYKGRDLDTAEAQALSQFEDTFKKLQELYRDAFMDANATVALIAEGGDVTGDTDIDGAEGDHLLSDRSMVEGAGLRFIPTKMDGKRILEYRVEDADGNAVTEVDGEMIKDSPLGNLVTSAVEGGYISKADAKVQYEFLAELVNMCLQYKGVAPVWETAGTLVFSAIKNNADKQYGKTIDFSTVCKKTQAIVDAMSEAMLRLGRGLTRAEVETIYLEVGKAGEETPCPVCYVFSRWMGIGGILDQMSRFQNKYVPMKDADIRAFMEDIEDRIDKRANTPNKKGELKADFFDKDGNIKQGQVIADLKNKASSKAASALKALSKNSDIKLQIQELEALAKTQDAKGKKATEKKITSLKKKLVDVSESEAIMKSANDEVELYEAYQWLTRTLMVKDANDNWVRNKDFKSVPMGVLFDLNKGDEFASGYPLSWAFRTGKGASAGKAIVPYADARVGETIQGIAKSDIKDIKVGLDLNPFLNGDKQTQKKLLETARLKQLRQNLIGGQRYQSTSDFRYEYGSDYLITFLEMQAIGAKVQLYTKVIEAVDFLATVGAECNLSVMPLSDGFITPEDGTKKLVYSSVTGINGKAAIEKTHQYNNVQLILVGISDEHIRLALEGDEVTFVIPFHGSGNSVHQIQALMNLLGENLDVTTAQDYTPVQSDHHLKKKTQAQKDAWNLRKKIIMGKAGTLTAAEHRILKENQFLDDMYRRFYEDESAEEYGVALTEDQANQIFPYEYWDKSLTYDQADQNGERFKQYCETLGIVPRFSGVDSDGKNVGFGDFTNAKGYWKLLIDRRMYENVYDENGNWVGYGKYHHPKTIDVTNFKAETIDPEWGTAHYGEVMAKSNDPKKTNKIVDAAIAQFENKGEIKPSERDSWKNIESIQGLEGYSVEEVIDITKNHIQSVLEEYGEYAEIIAVRPYGSRAKGTAKTDSDLDIVVQYEGDIREDSMFNMLNDEDSKLFIEGIEVDINPIRADDSGDIEDYLGRVYDFDKNSQGNKYSERDSEGNTLSKEQQEFFKDSKVRWGESLMPVYHGTRREFTVFDATKGYDENRVGGLLWAAKDYEYAKDYSYSDEPIVMKGYLNITNLLDIGDIDSYTNYEKRLQEIADLVKLTPSELEAMVDYKRILIYDITSSKAFRDRIVELGYDGVVAWESGLQTFGFVNSNQFKNTDNKKPTENPDIRYSFRDSESGMANDGLSAYNDELTKFIKARGDYIVDSFAKLEKVVNLAFDEPNTKATAYFGIVNAETLKKIKDSIPNMPKASKDILFKEGRDYSIATTLDSIRHIADEKGLKREDIIDYLDRLADTIIDFESVTFDFYTDSYKNRVPGLLFKKTFADGALISFDLISQNKRSIVLQSLYLDSVDYKKKKSAKTLLMQNSLSHTPEVRAGQTSTDSIYQKTETVKRKLSERDTDSSNRAILANALESVAQNDIERNKLAQYKEKIALIETEEQRLSEIQKQLFTKGAVEPTERKALQFEAKQIANRINTYDRQLLNLESTTALKNVLNREKALAMKKQREKDNAFYKERKEKSATTAKIKGLKLKFERMLQRPTDRQYVPFGLAEAIIDVCTLIDTDTPLYRANGELNKAQLKRNQTKEKLQALKDEYEKLRKHSDPMYSGEFDEIIYDMIAELNDKYKDKNIRDMSLEELDYLYHDILKPIDETLADARKLIGKGEAADVYEAGYAIIDEQTEIAKNRKKDKRSTATKAKDSMINLSLSPVRNIERMSGYNEDSALVDMFNDFEIGVRRKNKFVMDYYKAFEALTKGENAKNYESAIYDEYMTCTDENGKKFAVSKMEMMQAILSLERERANNKTHISKGGLVFADLKLLRKGKLGEAISSENAHKVPQATDLVAQFQQKLANDKWAQDYMAEAHKFFDGKAKDAVNDTTLALKHRIIAKDKSYIPFEVDKSFVVREISAANDIQQTINSYGMLKETKDKAPQPLIMTGLNNVLDRHIDQVATIYGLAIPIRNFNKVWNVQSVEGVETTVQRSIEKNWGVDGKKFVEQVVQDLQGSRGDKQSWLYRKIKSGYITATFTLNLSVVSKQIGSLFASTSMLEWRNPASLLANLVYTMANYKKISAEVDKYTASVWMRRQGMSDAEVYTLITEGQKSKIARTLNKAPAILNPTKWITAMDSAVALSLWKYCKEDVKKAHPELSGEELNIATASFFDSVVENTQSMTDVLHRPEIQKRGDTLGEVLGMFKTDLYQMSGQLQNAVGKVSADSSKENWKALGRTVCAVTSSAVWGMLMTALFAAIRYKVDPYRDDEDELTAESWMKRLAFVLGGDLAGYLFPLFGSEAVGTIETVFYGERDDVASSITLDAVNDLYSTIISVATTLKEGETPTFEQYKKLAVKGLQLFGIPANNVTRLVEAVKLHAEDISHDEFLSFEAGANRPKSDQLYRAIMRGDEEEVEELKSTYKDEASYETAVRKALRENDERIKEAAEAYINGDIRERDRILAEIVAEGYFDEELVAEAIKAEANALDADTEEEIEEEDEEKATSIYKADDINVALESGDNELALEIIDDLVKTKVENGMEEDKARSSVKSSVTSYWKPLYKEAYKNKDSEEMKRIRFILADTGLYGRPSEVSKTCQEWAKELAKEKNK